MNKEELTVLEKLGKIVLDLRKKAKMTQEEVAEKASQFLLDGKIYRTDLSAFEKRGEKISGADKIDAILRVFGHELSFAEKKNIIDLRVEKEKLDEIEQLIDEMNHAPVNPEKRKTWGKLKEALHYVFVGAMDEVIADNIKEDQQFLEECQEEAASRKHAASQHQSTNHQET